jgi:DNA-directed RNA polymerase specialized sigma24 family protein
MHHTGARPGGTGSAAVQGRSVPHTTTISGVRARSVSFGPFFLAVGTLRDDPGEEFGHRVAQLPDGQRDVYRMVVEMGMSRLDVAAELGITAGTVRVHLRRAKIRLASTARDPRSRNPEPAVPPPRYMATDFRRVDTSPSCLAQLPPRRRQVVRQHLAGASVADIAVRLGVAAATVRSHLSQAMRSLPAATD